MFQQEIEDISKEDAIRYALNVFGIVDDILIVGYYTNGKDNDITLR